VKVWADGVNFLASVAKRYPQTAFAGLTIMNGSTLFVQCQGLLVAALFGPSVEKAIRSRFLPS
jgi:hypothetical protein